MFENVKVGKAGIDLGQIKRNIEQTKLQKQQMDAAQTALDYQKKQIEQQERATNANKIGQEYTAMQFEKALSSPNLIDDEGKLQMQQLVAGNFTPDKLKTNYQEFSKLYTDKGLTPNPNLFAQTQEQLSVMEARNKLDTLLKYRDSQQLSSKDFNLFLRGGENSFVGAGIVQNLLNQVGGDYNNFIERTGYEPRFETFGESIIPFRGPEKESVLGAIGKTALTVAPFFIPGGIYIKGGKLLGKGLAAIATKLPGGKQAVSGVQSVVAKAVAKFGKKGAEQKLKGAKIVPPNTSAKGVKASGKVQIIKNNKDILEGAKKTTKTPTLKTKNIRKKPTMEEIRNKAAGIPKRKQKVGTEKTTKPGGAPASPNVQIIKKGKDTLKKAGEMTKSQKLIMSGLFDKTSRKLSGLTLKQSLKELGISKKEFDAMVKRANKVPPPKPKKR